jgi:hypothetical protein
MPFNTKPKQQLFKNTNGTALYNNLLQIFQSSKHEEEKTTSSEIILKTLKQKINAPSERLNPKQQLVRLDNG